MPLYEYTCQDCGTAFEQIRKFDDRQKPATCPSCHAEGAVLGLSAPGRVGVGGASSASTASLPQTGGGGGCASGACGLW